MYQLLIDFFYELPDSVKLLAFVLLFIGLVGYTVWTILSWRQIRHLKSDLRLAKNELKSANEEITTLRKRFQALDQRIDSQIWTAPDRHAMCKFAEKTTRKARFVAICNFKGGVGKTTFTLNLGVTLSLKGKRVLIVDLDWQGTLSKLAVPGELLSRYRLNEWTTEAFFNEKATVTEAKKWAVSLKDAPRCDILLTGERLDLVEFRAQSRYVVHDEQEVRFLVQKLLHHPDFSQHYDYVLFDCPPRMTTACVNAMTCADYILVPTTLSQVAIEAVPATLDWRKKLSSVVRADFLGVVITRARMRSGQLTARERSQYGNLQEMIRRHQVGDGFVFSAIIPDSPKIHHVAEEYRPAAVCDAEVRAVFDAVAVEFERKASI